MASHQIIPWGASLKWQELCKQGREKSIQNAQEPACAALLIRTLLVLPLQRILGLLH